MKHENGPAMFEPITTQKQLDEVISDRIKRERQKVQRKDAEELQQIIDKLKGLRDAWTGTGSDNFKTSN